MSRIEARGVTCLQCAGLDLKSKPDHSKAGFGECMRNTPVHFVSFRMSRNCRDFDAAAPEVVEARDTWAAKNVVMFWERKR